MHKENDMALPDRLVSLKRKHKELHDRIEALEAERAPDKYVRPLKKEKLELKDNITAIESYLHQMDNGV